MDRYSEVERKFDAEPGALLPDLSGAAAAVSEAVESQLDATYFDTATGSRPSLTTRFTGSGWPMGPFRSPHGARSRSSSCTGTGPSSTRSAANCKPPG